MLKTVEDQPAINENYRERIQRLEMMVSTLQPADRQVIPVTPWPDKPMVESVRPKTAEERGL